MDGILGYLKATDYLPELEGRIALVKSDLNVPFTSGDDKPPMVADPFRILQAAPFIRELINAGIIPLLVTHLGRPKGYNPSLTLDPIIGHLSGAIEKNVEIIRFDPERVMFNSRQFNPDYIRGLFKDGVIPILDNIRFHTDEIKNRDTLARALVSVVNLSIQNSFGTAHRKETTSNRIHEYIPGLAGSLLVDEIESHAKTKRPGSPYVVIVGGDKVEDSLQLMRAIFRAEKTTHWSNMFNPELNLQIGERLVDYVLVGGHLMYAFDKAKTIVWNGPLGVDDERYIEGTRRLIDSIHANKEAVKEIGGGSTNFMTSAYEKESGRKFDMGFRSTVCG